MLPNVGTVTRVRTDFGGGSLRSVVLGLALRNSVRRFIDVWSLAPGLPWPYEVVDHVGRLQRKVAGTTFEEVRLGTCRVQVVRTPSSRPERHVLYFHGGAFIIGGWHLHGSMLSRIADASEATVTAVEYRKLPRHGIADATADGVAAYRHLLAQGVPPEDIVFGGDSAGGWLVFTVADAAMAEGLPTPAGITALSPLLDLDLERSPVGRQRRGCTLFGPRAIPTFARLVERRGGPGRTPTECELSSLPPVLLQVSSSETLYDQVCLMHDQLEAAGVPVQLQVWDGQVHVFQAATLLAEAHQAIGQVGEFVRRTTGVRARVSA